MVEEKKHPAVSAVGKTDPGKVRGHNEDSYFINEEMRFFIVADGVGGHQAGEKASEMVVKILPEMIRSLLNENKDYKTEELVSLLSSAITKLNREVNVASNENPSYRGMGATVVSCLVYENHGIFSYMGDSRAYLLRDSVISRLTQDHSIVGLMMRMGELTQKEADQHPMRHVITRHVGMDGDFGPDTIIVELKPGDKVLLCTDGLSDMVSDEDMSEIISSVKNIDEACEQLVEAANDAGGRDNITVVIIEYGTVEKIEEENNS
jgi:PPM family protein phosphatase